MYEREGIFDKRTQKINKKQYNIYIGAKKNIENLHAKTYYRLKGEFFDG